MDGIILINKEKNYTSNDIVQIAKKLFNKKVGHTGTLDPMATGVLPLLIDKGTLCSKYLMNHNKIYIAKLKLGVKTNTGDITGKILEKADFEKKSITKDFVEANLKSFIGKQKQIPPIYSAIKVNGKKLYQYARQGQNIEIQPRNIEIYDINLISIKDDEIEFKVHCSKGTYIRSLCEDIAKKLGTIGTMSSLERVKVGDFDISNSVKIGVLKENFNSNFLDKYFINIETLFQEFPEIKLENSKRLFHFINGVKLSGFSDLKDGCYRIYDKSGKFIGIGILKNGLLKRDIIL